MSCRPRPPRSRYGLGQRGFSLVAAVFLIVVLAGLGAFAVQVAMSQYQSSNLGLLGERTLAAANAGIGYAADLALGPAGTCRANSILPAPRGSPLAGFVVRLTCVRTRHQANNPAPPPPSRTYYAYALTSTASFGTYGRPNYAARTVTVNVTNAPP